MELRDCTWCGSAGSIERDLCQVCLMRYQEDGPAVVIVLPDPAPRAEVESLPAADEQLA